jgi:hypothetical protein
MISSKISPSSPPQLQNEEGDVNRKSRNPVGWPRQAGADAATDTSNAAPGTDPNARFSSRKRRDALTSQRDPAIASVLRSRLLERMTEEGRSTGSASNAQPSVAGYSSNAPRATTGGTDVSSTRPQVFSIEDAHAATTVDPRCSLAGLFETLSDKALHTIFGCEDQPLTHVDTELSRKTNSLTGEVALSGSVCFSNLYGETIWVRSENYRDPARASFYMSDIVKLQATRAGRENGPKYFVSKRVISEDGKTYFKENSFSHMQELTQMQLQNFMTNTVNGRSSARILREFNLTAESARVLAINEADGDADQDSAYENRYRNSSSHEQPAEPDDLEYSVVIVTAPLQSASSGN